MFDTRRRELITLLGGAAASRPLAARAQQPARMRRIGALLARGRGTNSELHWLGGSRFRAGPARTRLGGVGGQQHSNRLPLVPGAILSAFVGIRPQNWSHSAPDVGGWPECWLDRGALQQASRTVPIVFSDDERPSRQGGAGSRAWHAQAGIPPDFVSGLQWVANGWR